MQFSEICSLLIAERKEEEKKIEEINCGLFDKAPNV